MEDSQFDKILKAGLDALKAPYDAQSWDAFAQKLDARQAPPDVDAAARRLQNLEAAFDPADWAAMERRLVRERRRRGVLWIKIAEAALLLLLLGYLSGFPGDQSARPDRPVRPLPEPLAAAADRFAPAPPDKTSADRGIAIQAASAGSGPAKTAIAGSTEAPQTPDQMHEWPEAAREQAPAAAVRAMDEKPIAIPFLPVEATALSELVAGALPARPFFPSPAFPSASAAKGFYVGGVAAAERNRMIAGDHQHTSAGFSAGLGAGYRWKKWGLETGLQYARRQYQPASSVTLFDGNVPNVYYGANLRTVSANLLSIPLRATRLAWRTGKLEIHAVAGAAAHLALQKSYEYETLVFTGQPPSGLPVIGPDQQAQLRPEAQGVLQGGRLRENAYVTLDFGLRLQYPMSSEYVFFVEPAMRRALGQGIGPKPGKLHTTGFNLGIWKQI
jgi:hypothetical protein